MVYYIQYFSIMMLLVFSTIASWYEGSELRDRQLEWKHSTFFSNAFKKVINNSEDISQLDYFIYAAKFKPMFPIIMFLSVFYIILLSGHLILKNQVKKLTLFHFSLSLVLLIMVFNIIDSPTLGGRYFSWLLFSLCLLNIIMSINYYLNSRKLEMKY